MYKIGIGMIVYDTERETLDLWVWIFVFSKPEREIERERGKDRDFHNKSIHLIHINFYNCIVIELTIRFCVERERETEREIVRRKNIKNARIEEKGFQRDRDRERERCGR